MPSRWLPRAPGGAGIGFYYMWFLETSQQPGGADVVIPLLQITLLSLGLLTKLIEGPQGFEKQNEAALTLKSVLF